MWVGWEDWAGDTDLTQNMDRVMGGALTIQQDTRTDPVFDEFMETVRPTSYSFLSFFHSYREKSSNILQSPEMIKE